MTWLEELEASDGYANSHRSVGKFFSLKNDEDSAIIRFISPFGKEHEEDDRFNPGKKKTEYKFGVHVYEWTGREVPQGGVEAEWDVGITMRDLISKKIRENKGHMFYSVVRYGEAGDKQVKYRLSPVDHI